MWWIVALSLGLRLINLNQSLWLDEAVTAKVVKNFQIKEIVTNFSPNDFHPPLYYLGVKAWTGLFGYSEVILRLPSVLFSLITIYIVYLVSGKWAAILASVNPLLVYYSQEARMYSMAVMWLMAAIWAIRKKRVVLFNVFCFLAFLTFYGSVFLIATIIVYVLVKRGRKGVVKHGWGIILALVIVWPLLGQQMINSKVVLAEVTNWTLALGKVTIKNLLLVPIKFSVGRISFYPKIVYWLISGIWTTGIVVAGLMVAKKNKFWLTMVAGPLFLGLVFSFFSPMMQYFRFLYLVPIMAIILSRSRFRAVIALGFGLFSVVYLVNPNFHREDWKSLSKELGKKVYMIESVADPVKYYQPKTEVADMRGKIIEKEIEVVPYAEEIHGFNHAEELTKLGYKLIEEKSFRELKKEKWLLFD